MAGMSENAIAQQIVDAAYRVHTVRTPDLMENAVTPRAGWQGCPLGPADWQSAGRAREGTARERGFFFRRLSVADHTTGFMPVVV